MSISPTNVSVGTLKTQEWKTRDGKKPDRKCRTGKRGIKNMEIKNMASVRAEKTN